MEQLLFVSGVSFLCIAFAYLLDGGFIVAIDLRCFFAFRCGLGCRCGSFFAELKLMGKNDADRSESGENPDQELRSEILLNGGSLLR